MRISREQMLMEWAYSASKRGTCGRLAVGAVIARDARPVSAGYVGAPAGEPHCLEAGCDLTRPCTRTTHAEINAINFAKAHNISTYACDMFITDSPCLDCAVAIEAAGICRVFFDREYRVTEGIRYLIANGVSVHRVLANGMTRQY